MKTSAFHRRNFGREILWYFVLIAAAFLISGMVRNNYASIVEMRSLTDFIVNIVFAALSLIILSFFWWRAATTEKLIGIRESLEQYSFRWSVIFIIIAFFLAMCFYFRCNILSSASGRRYSLDCVFMLPAVFAALMYFLPPVQITGVILPGGRVLGTVLRIIAALAAAAGAFVSFAVNFIF